MKKVIIFIVVLLGLGLFVSIAVWPKIGQNIDSMKPEIKGVTLQWGEVTPQTTAVIATVQVNNPNPFILPVKKVVCTITMDDIRMGSAETLDLRIEKNAEFPITILGKIDNTKIPAFWSEHIKRNEKSEAVIDVNATFDLAGTEFSLPFQFKHPIETNMLAELKKVGPIPVEKRVKLPLIGETTVFKVALTSLSGKWGASTLENTELKLMATIQNDNIYPLPVPKIAYSIDMNKISLAAGESSTNHIIAPKSSKDIEVVLNLKTSLMDKWFVSHIQQGEKSTFATKASLAFGLPKEVEQLLGQVGIAIPTWEGTHEFKTDILGAIK